MANVFKNYINSAVGTSPTGLACPAGGTITVIGMSLTNETASNIKVTSYVSDNSASKNGYLAYDAIIPPGGNFVVIGGDQKVVLESNDQLLSYSDTLSSFSIVISYMLTT